MKRRIAEDILIPVLIVHPQYESVSILSGWNRKSIRSSVGLEDRSSFSFDLVLKDINLNNKV